LLDNAAWSRRGRVDRAHHATMATLRRARCDMMVLGQLQCDLERSHLIDDTPQSSYFGQVRHRAVWCAIGRVLDACNRASLSDVCGACVIARRCGRCCRSGWCKSSLSFSMTSRTCCSHDSHRDAALTTANNQLFQMRDPLRSRFDSLISDISGFPRGYLSSSTETHNA